MCVDENKSVTMQKRLLKSDILKAMPSKRNRFSSATFILIDTYIHIYVIQFILKFRKSRNKYDFHGIAFHVGSIARSDDVVPANAQYPNHFIIFFLFAMISSIVAPEKCFKSQSFRLCGIVTTHTESSLPRTLANPSVIIALIGYEIIITHVLTYNSFNEFQNQKECKRSNSIKKT